MCWCQCVSSKVRSEFKRNECLHWKAMKLSKGLGETRSNSAAVLLFNTNTRGMNLCRPDIAMPHILYFHIQTVKRRTWRVFHYFSCLFPGVWFHQIFRLCFRHRSYCLHKKEGMWTVQCSNSSDKHKNFNPPYLWLISASQVDYSFAE